MGSEQLRVQPSRVADDERDMGDGIAEKNDVNATNAGCTAQSTATTLVEDTGRDGRKGNTEEKAELTLDKDAGFLARESRYIEVGSDQNVNQTFWQAFQPLNIFREGPLPEDAVIAWLKREHPYEIPEVEPRISRFIVQRWTHRDICENTFTKTPFPFSKRTVNVLTDAQFTAIPSQCISMWHNDCGTSAALMEPRSKSIMFQTPNDGGAFCSVAISCCHGLTEGYLVAHDDFNPAGLMADLTAYGPLINHPAGLPILILKRHVDMTGQQLTTILTQVAQVEDMVAESRPCAQRVRGSKNYGALTQSLLRSRMALMILERRWHWELRLAENIQCLINVWKHAGFAIGKDQTIKILQAHWSLSKGRAFDFESLPKRIETQISVVSIPALKLTTLVAEGPAFIQIHSLVAQRDSLITQRQTQLSLYIARSSRQVALDSKRDSESMKTIAVMTMIFLPGTFVATFFSMTMFSWQADSGNPQISKYLWVYFLITIPLTGLVLMAWHRWTKSRSYKLDRDEALLEADQPLPEFGPTASY